MPQKRKKTKRASLMALCALLSIWICAIILPKEAAAEPLETLAEARTRPVLVIDAGHGGMDGGASAADGTPESRYNLSIALRLRDMASLLGITTVMTRESEEIAYPPEITTIAGRKRWDTRERVERINAVENGVLMSIHQNFYPTPAPHGPQVLYAGDELSRRLGEQVQENLTAFLTPDNRRVPTPASRDIYIMAHVSCPAVLVECGFLSHPQEAMLLGEETYQIRLAAVLAESFLQFTEEDSA